ncbi:MAG: vWA domain-containing protein [Acidimicrobiales bacterium]
MRRGARVLIVVGIAAAAMSGGTASGVGGRAPATTVAEDFRVLAVDSSSYPVVESMVVVPPALSGRSLSSESFEVRHGGSARTVEAVQLDPRALELVLMVDDSVGGDGFHRAQGALLEVPVHLPQARVAVVHSGGSATTVWPLAADPDLASQAVRSLRPGVSGALERGVESALQVFSADEVDEDTSRAVVMIVGDPTVDPYRVVGSALTARQMGVTFYVITVAESVPADFDRLASMTNGRAVAVDHDALVAAIDRTMADLRGQYRLRFDLSGGDVTAGLEGRVAGDVVAAVGIHPVAATVNAGGISADIRMSVPPPSGPSTGAGGNGGEPSPRAPWATDWLPALAVLLLLVLAAVGVDRFAAPSAARPPTMRTPSRPRPASVVQPPVSVTEVETDDRPLVGVGPALRSGPR